jgi:hypothetical protein
VNYPPKRPATLTAALWTARIVGVLYVVGAAVIFVSGKETIRAYLAEETGVSDDIIDQLVGAEIDEAYGALVVKAVIAIVAAAVILVLTLNARSGVTWARITLAASLVVAMCAGGGLQIGDADVLPNASFAAAGLAPLLSVVAIVLLFLPASNRHARARSAPVS